MAEIIVALDKETAEENLRIVDKLQNEQIWYKVGPVLYQQNPSVINTLKINKKKVMLDLKFHDIPNTVKGACCEAAKAGVDILTIHLSGGKEMIKAAKEGVVEGFNLRRKNINVPLMTSPSIVVGVSILTSITSEDLEEIGYKNYDIETHIKRLVKLGVSCGVDGIVCSPLETALVRKEFKNLKIINPGIRLKYCVNCSHLFNGICNILNVNVVQKKVSSCNEWKSKDDQKRITSPEEASKNGADFLVIGRPIYDDPNPIEIVRNIKSIL